MAAMGEIPETEYKVYKYYNTVIDTAQQNKLYIVYTHCKTSLIWYVHEI